MKLKNCFRLGVLAAIATTTLGISQAQAASITWTESMSTALSQSKKTGKPIFIDFSAVWCGPCKQMKKTTFKDAKVIAESKKWIMVHIHGDKQEAVAKKYKIEAYPTLMIMSPKGKVVAREIGGHNPGDFLKWMQSKYSAAKK